MEPITHGYFVVAFYMLMTGPTPVVSVKPEVDNYRTYAAVADCRKAKLKVMRANKDVFYSDCVKIPKIDPNIAVIPSREAPAPINLDDMWIVTVDSEVSSSSIPWMGDKLKSQSKYPQETELLCRRIAELLERFGDKSKHKFQCGKDTVVIR